MDTNTPQSPETPQSSHIGRTILKVLLWIIGIPLLLVVLLLIALLFPPTQNWLADKGANYLSDMLDTEVRIGHVKTDLRNSLVLEDVYIEDQRGDTLLYAGRLGLDMNFFALLNSEINISSATLRNATVHLETYMPDSTTNYDFLLNAFASDTAAQPVDTAAAPFTYNLGNIELHHVLFTLDDEIYGNHVRTRIGSLVADMDELAPEKEIYRLNSVALKNTYINYTQTKVAPPDNTAPQPLTMQFGLGAVALEDVKFNFINKVAAQRIAMNIGQAQLTADNINLPDAKIDLANFQLQNSFVGYFQDELTPTDSLAVNPAKIAKELDESVEETRGAPVNWVVTLDNLDVNDLNVQFGNYNTPVQKQGMDFNHLDFKNIFVELNDLYYSQNRIAADLQNLRLQEKSGFEIEKFTTNLVVDSTHAELSDLYLETGNSIIRNHLALGYPSLEAIADNFERLRINADLVNTKIGPKDIGYFMPEITNEPNFRQVLNRPLYLDGRVQGPMDNLRIQQLQAAGLTGTAFNLTGSIKNISDPNQIYVDLDIDRFTTTRTDVKAFLPAGTLPPGYQIPTRITLTGGITGGMESLELENINLTAGPNTRLQTTGTIRNLQNPDQLAMNLQVKNLETTRSDLYSFLPESLFPPDIQLPEQMQLSGTFNGTLDNFTTNATINSSFGNASANIRMRPGEQYNGTVSLDNFDLGKLLKQEGTYGKITTTANISGTGLALENLSGKVDATLEQFEYNNYTYKNVIINGTANKNLFTGNLRVNDPNLQLNFEGTVNLRQETPVFDFVATFDEADLQALNFYDQNLRLQGKVDVDLRGASLNTISGVIDAGNLTVRQNAKTYQIDSLLIRVDNSPQQTYFVIRSDFLKGFFKGENGAEELVVAFQKYIDSYFNIQNEPFPEAVTLKDFVFDFKMGRTGILTGGLIPDLKKLGPGVLSGSYVSAVKDMNLEGYLPLVIYSTYHLDSLRFNVDGDPSQLGYVVKMDQLYDTTFQVNNVTLAGNAQGDNLNMRLAIAREDGQVRFALGGTLNDLRNAYRFRFTPGDVILNSEVWNVSPDNYLQYFETGDIYADDIRLERNGSALTIDSPGPLRPNAPLQIGFNDFQLSDISQVIERQDSLFTGTVNGTIMLQDITDKMAFTSDLRVANFTYDKNLIGDIALEASNATGDRFNVTAVLSGNGNNVTIDGYYIAQATANALNLRANISSLNLNTIEGFTEGVIDNLSGSVTGEFAITGSITQPDIRGVAKFTDATFSLEMFGAIYRLPSETIVFNEQGMNFSNFTLVDSTGNKAVIDGTIFTDNYLDYRFALDAVANNFVALNSTAADNALYYGLLIVDAKAKVQGSMNRPVINTQVEVLGGSAVTLVIPAAAAGRIEHVGIVDFVDINDTTASRLAQEAMRDTLSQTEFTGLEINALIDVEDDSEFTIIIDPITGDYIEVQGEGLLNAGIDPSGKISLSGRYVASDGKYQLNFYDLAEREFNIKSGSTITWNGDPLDATLDVKAIYDVEAAPYELVADQMAGQGLNQYRQEYPFQVIINLEGDMLKPDISFDIQLPEEERSGVGGEVAAKLSLLRQDVSELNRQVFSLIVLGRFMAQDPLLSAGGGGLESIARNSVSDLLSDQLNKLTGNFLGGLGLELGLNSYQDYSTGEGQNRTDLNVALNQQFLNNRLIVKVGTDVGLEGNNNQPGVAGGTRGFGGTVSVEYLILPDGRLRLRAFKQNAADVITEAAVQETGLALIYVRDFDSFSDIVNTLFKPNISE